MYGEYFVLVTDNYYGIFEIGAKSYPCIFKKNIESVCCIEETNINEFLFTKVGRNSLAKHDYKWFLSLGKVYAR